MAAESDRTLELLEKVLIVQMYQLGASQQNIAKAIKKSKSDVNNFLKLFPKEKRE